jgi:hypothetical protein
MTPRYFIALQVILQLCAVPIILNAQIPGKGIIKAGIMNEQKKALPGASVFLKNPKDSSILKTVLSNDLGVFIFNDLKEGNYFIEVTMIGFERLSVANIIIKATNATIDLGVLSLKASSKTLNDVTVIGQKPLIEREIDKTVVNVENNINNAGTTVLELMQKLPGVQMTPDGQITLNGKSGVNIFIDGKPTYLSATDLAALLGGMPSSNIQKIEIMTNPSSKYDAAGTAGIINIVKKKNHKDGFNGGVNGSLGQGYYGMYSGGVTLSYKNKNYNLYLNNSYSYNKTLFGRMVTNDIFDSNNGLLTEQVSDNKEINIDRAYTPSLGLDLYLSKRTTLSLSGDMSLRVAHEQTTSTMDILDGNKVKMNSEFFTSKNDDKPFNYNAGVHLVHQVDTMGREISFDVGYSNYRNMPAQYNSTVLYDEAGNIVSQSNVFLDRQRRLHIYAAKADYVHPIKGNGRLEVGWKSSYVKVNNDNTYYNLIGSQKLIDSSQSNYLLNTENINAIYVNINKQYKKLTIQAGLRGEQTVTKGEQLLHGESIQQNYLQLFPTAFLNYELNDHNGFIARFGRRTERADYAEMVPFRIPLTPTLYFQGNPNLRPQLSYHGEFSYTYHKALFVTFGYDIYHDYIRTLPYLDSNKVTVTRIPTNIQRAHSWNIDIAYSKKMTSWWSTDNTLSIYKNSFNGHSGSFSLNNLGTTAFNLTMNNSLTINDKLSAECDFQYSYKHQMINTTYGTYSVLSLGIKCQLFNNKGAISINANNVFQTEDQSVIDKYEYFSQYSYWRFYTRALRLNFNYRFGNGKSTKMHQGSAAEDEQRRAGN